MAHFFVNCDWGTSRLRLRLMAVESVEVLSEVCSNAGVSALAATGADADRAERFRLALGRQLEQLAGQCPELGPCPVIISGMASSTIGWQELPYAPVPWRLDGSDVVARELEPVNSPGGTHRVLLLPGLRTATDVMRGEETQTLGLFQLDIARQVGPRARVILPGTHSKHVRVESGAIVGFHTFMTGELFDVLGRHSILRHSIAAEAKAANGLPESDPQAFAAGVREAQNLPLPAALFHVRTRQVLDKRPATENRAFLSGVLIGAELAGLAQDTAADGPIVLCADGTLGEAYAQAGAALGLGERMLCVAQQDVERLSALGQACVARRLAII
jgi:2-dehydro-3-deoxygalactonokinase